MDASRELETSSQWALYIQQKQADFYRERKKNVLRLDLNNSESYSLLGYPLVSQSTTPARPLGWLQNLSPGETLEARRVWKESTKTPRDKFKPKTPTRV